MRPHATERIPVDFAGEGSGVDELSWGMKEIWQSIVGQQSSLPIGGRNPLPDGTTVSAVADELCYLMTRFPSMRTRLTFAPDGRPRQQLFASGRTALEVFDAGEDEDPEQVAAAVEAHYRETEFDYAEEWPVRMAVVRRNGLAVHLVSVMSHLVSDGAGGLVMLRNVHSRDTTAPQGLQQLEQARWQQGPAGQRQNERALRYWEGVLRAIPAQRFSPANAADPRQPRHWGAEFSSPALRTAVPVLAARTGTDASTVLLALFAIALHRITGIGPVVVRPVVNNRFRSSLADVVCMVAQAGVCALDVEDVTVDEAVARVSRAAMATYKHAYFDPEQLNQLIARVSAERGEEVDVSCFFNDLGREYRQPGDAPVPGVEELRESLPGLAAQSSFRWLGGQDVPVERLFVTVSDAPGALQVAIRVDTHFISLADGEALAHGMEEAAVRAALDPEASTTASPSGVGQSGTAR